MSKTAKIVPKRTRESRGRRIGSSGERHQDTAWLQHIVNGLKFFLRISQVLGHVDQQNYVGDLFQSELRRRARQNVEVPRVGLLDCSQSGLDSRFFPLRTE